MDGSEAAGDGFAIRPMTLDVDRRISYFHDADDVFLHELGVDRSLLPERAVWKESYRVDFDRSLAERDSYGVMWLVNDEVVGWCSTDKIEVGEQAYMHLHIADPENRAAGYGAQLIAISVRHFFDVLELKRLYCEPHAFNTAPNRALQRAGFKYEFTHIATPGPINFEQTTTRWIITEPPPTAPPPGVD